MPSHRLLVALADMNDEFQGEQIGSGHDVSAAAISQAADKLLDLFEMQRKRVAR